MNIINTYNKIIQLFKNMGEKFDKELWHSYAHEISLELPNKCLEDSEDYDFYINVLPVLESVMKSKEKLEKLNKSFELVTENLKERIYEALNVELDVDIILYLGLCNAAGWATKLDEKVTILLGVEKIIELGWYDVDSMIGLIYHELGHIWHDKIGTFYIEGVTVAQDSLLQLYKEGIAMHFEHLLMNNDSYYHQDKNGWLDWCNENKNSLFAEYKRRVDSNESTQDFFGDWCSYQGHSDVGYYLGAELIKSMAANQSIKEVANMKTSELYNELCNMIQ